MSNHIIAKNRKLIPKGAVAITKQMNDVANTTGRQTSYTNQFRLPKTKDILIALGLTNTLNSSNDAIYENIDAQLYMDNTPIENWGRMKIKGVADDISATISGPEVGFFESLDGKGLHDLDLTGLDHNWNKQVIADSQAHEFSEGYTYPIINYGGLPFTSELDARYMHAAVYWMYLMRFIELGSGYTFLGEIFDDPLINKVVFPFSEGDYKHSDRYIEERSFAHFTNTQQVFSRIFATNETDFQIGNVDFSGVASYTAVNAITFQTISARVNVTSLTRNIQTTGDSLTVEIALIKNGPTILSRQTLTIADNTVSATNITLAAGESLSVIFIVNSVVQDSNATANISVTIDTGSFYTDPIENDINYLDDITGESFVPDWTQKEFLSAFMEQFQLVPNVDPGNKTVTFTPFSKVLDNKARAKDWSSKLVRAGKDWYKSKDSKIGNYGQTNYLSYKTDKTLGVSTTGQGEISATDKTLQPSKTMVTMPYAASESFVKYGVLVAQIKKYSGTYPNIEKIDNDGVEQRALFVHQTALSLTITDDDTDPNASIAMPANALVGKFIDPSLSESLAFSATIQAKYFQIWQEILTDPQRITALFNLKVNDIQNIDLFIPIWVDKFGEYYYINKIKNFTPNQITELELIRI